MYNDIFKLAIMFQSLSGIDYKLYPPPIEKLSKELDYQPVGLRPTSLFSKVTDDLYRGGKPTFNDLVYFKKEFGIKKVVSLDLEAGLSIISACKQLELKHVMAPLGDGTDPMVDNLKQNIIPHLTDGGPTYIHCYWGKDRTSMSVAMFRIYNGWSLENALNEARRFYMGQGLPSDIKESYYDAVKEFAKEQSKEPIQVSANVIDVSNIFQKKLEESQQKDVAKQFGEVLPQQFEETSPDDFTAARAKKQLSEIQQAAGTWMHRFSNVRKDDNGFFILKSDNPAGNKMSIGDLLSDHAMNMTPYWKITNIVGDRINLEPIGSNPFLTGVGAGGAKLDAYDIKVFTGAAEKERVERIQQSLEDGSATLDDVVYLLDGTVPVNMGPNGAQGGWYTATDSANRGGRKGLKPKDIMVGDANKLKNWGFTVPTKALSGEMKPENWNDWVNGNGSQDIDYIPKNLEAYLNYFRKMTQKGTWHYDEEALEEKRRKLSGEAATEYWENVIATFLENKEEFKNKYPHLPETLKELVELSTYYIEKTKTKPDPYLTEGEDESEQSILRNIFSKERRVAIRNVMKLIEMCRENPEYIKYLHDFIKAGGSDWSANEKVLDFFHHEDDVEGLKIALQTLKDDDNRRYAFAYLTRIDPESVIQLVNENESFAGLRGLFESLVNINKDNLTKEQQKQTFEKIVNIIERFNLIEKIEEGINSKNYSEKHNAQELLGSFNSAVGNLTSAKWLNQEIVQEIYPEQYNFIMELRRLNSLTR